MRAERWNNPITFSSVTAPPELTGMPTAGLGSYVPKVPRSLAIQVPAVKRTRDLIVSTLGAAEAHVINAARNTVPWELFDQPEKNVPRSVTMARTYEDMLFEEVAWWRVVEWDAKGWPKHVVRLEAGSVTVRKTGKVYVNSSTGNAQGVAWEYVPDSELIRFDSPNDGLLTAGARAIRTCLALAARVDQVAADPMPLGYFTPREGATGLGDKKEVDAFLDDWEDRRQRRQWGYVDDELEAKTLTWNPEQVQLKALWDQAVLEIARIGGVDPEELGVSTTTRTYANAEQRRLDLLDFTVLAYAKAFEDRCKMPDITPPGFSLVYDYTGFLRSDTKTRLETYEIGLRVGVYTPERIARIEKVPTVVPQQPATPPAPQTEDELSKARRGREMAASAGFSSHGAAPAGESLIFADETAGKGVRLNFVSTGDAVEFKADTATRTVSGTLVPWNVVAYSGGYRWEFAPGSLHWSDPARVKLDKDHVGGTEFGRGSSINTASHGLTGAFKVARGVAGDEALSYAEDGVYDGFSIEAGFDSEADGWTEHPDKPGVRLVHSATLRKVALTAMPAFDDARVTKVAATREGNGQMTAPTAPAGTGPAGAASAPPAMDWTAFSAGLTNAVTTAVTEAAKAAFANLPTPQAGDGTGIPARDPNATVTAGRAVVMREEPVYLMNGHGNSYVRDAWKARTEGDHEAADRLRKFMRQTEDASKNAMNPEHAAQFAATTGNSSAVIPPGYRPDMFVTQLMQGRPLVSSVSRGTLSDATPFNIPAYVSSSGLTAEHTEGVNPTPGSLVLGVKTVSPTAVSGLFELTREIVDSANPAIDAIALAAMQESYSQQTEALVYAELNGANGVGGVITNGFVPSGAQAATTTGQGDELLTGTRAQMALYPFRRFGAINRAHISQEATQGFSSATDSTGRPLLPYLGPQNASGTANAGMSGYVIDGVTFQPTWSMTGNAAGDADVLMFNSADVWAWESGLLMFRFEERGGPARIDLALFGYFATRILRPVGISAVRHTAA